MSRLRTSRIRCTQILDRVRGQCDLMAVIRCNACKQEFCEECWEDHLHMTVCEEETHPIAPGRFDE